MGRTAKAIWGAVAAFLAPGAVYVAANANDGMTSNEWIIAAALCFTTSAVVGGAVYVAPKNTP